MDEEFIIKYLACLKIIQPARVQDVSRYYKEFWGSDNLNVETYDFKKTHNYLKNNGMLVKVRVGTYILSMAAVILVSNFMGNKELDNRRLFLLKKQRKLYCK
ncbi:hypothetical protein K1X45_07095 [Pseudochrobactrum sp. Wa41.01b-1]|uniref:hypothetical protein n=1 Tax=Pseudochrobactrum sp. Wa41.01b-1 TaxID=2864102 RepID=UPI001C68C569|nr:hypothetical protein [Pseudochrobactrum sp. Wa41.01b-1]QYM74139.1 hypothetical protein K1X45_07095 [Pseudochrobactrum sp. Wa41.01b-1]